MPYIRRETRKDLDSYQVGGPFAYLDAGELTYVFYKIMCEHLDEDSRYEDYHRVLGAVEAAKLEFYRRKVAPYENYKITENGDIV